MSNDALGPLRETISAVLRAALGGIEQRARATEREVVRVLGAVSREPVLSRLHLTGAGGGELWFESDRAGMRLLDASFQPPPDAFGHALEVPLRAGAHLLSQLRRGALDAEAMLLAVAGLASETARDAFARTPFAFQLEVVDVPVLGSVVAQVGLGRPRIAAPPEFRLSVESDELEDAFEQGTPPHQLFLAGKVRIDGDVAKAMLLGMTLAELG